MEFTEVVRRRRMVRHFTPQPVAAEVIERVLDLARHAPSAGFTQGQAFIVVTRPELKQALAAACGEAYYVELGHPPWISAAPVLIVACTSEAAYRRRYAEPDKGSTPLEEQDWPVPYWHLDIGCAVMILLLAVVNEGLAAGFAGAFDLDQVRAILGLPAEVTPVGVIPIGHGAPDVPSPSLKRGRVPDAAWVHHEGW